MCFSSSIRCRSRSASGSMLYCTAATPPRDPTSLVPCLRAILTLLEAVPNTLTNFSTFTKALCSAVCWGFMVNRGGGSRGWWRTVYARSLHAPAAPPVLQGPERAHTACAGPAYQAGEEGSGKTPRAAASPELPGAPASCPRFRHDTCTRSMSGPQTVREVPVNCTKADSRTAI